MKGKLLWIIFKKRVRSSRTGIFVPKDKEREAKVTLYVASSQLLVFLTKFFCLALVPEGRHIYRQTAQKTGELRSSGIFYIGSFTPQEHVAPPELGSWVCLAPLNTSLRW